MSRESIYREQLKALGIYDQAFEPEIKLLAELERRRTRAKKAWSATAEEGEKPSFTDPHYQVIVQLEREILTHRETLGLTPRALKRVKGAYYETFRVSESVKDEDQPSEPTVLDFVRAKYAT